MSITEFHAMWETQGGKCGICDSPLETGQKGHAIDHNHDTGEVRSILCQHCNKGLGYFKDNPAVLEKAVTYLHAKGNYAYDA